MVSFLALCMLGSGVCVLGVPLLFGHRKHFLGETYRLIFSNTLLYHVHITRDEHLG